MGRPCAFTAIRSGCRWAYAPTPRNVNGGSVALFLSPYIGTGTKDDPFRPRGLDEPGASAIDIRLDPTRSDGNGIGVALLWLPVGTPDPVGVFKLADDYGDTLSQPMRNQLNSRLGLSFAADATIQDAVETILLRPTDGLWHQLRPSRGRLEAWLGSGTGKRRWIDQPVVAGGTITDDFNRANENPIASPWTAIAESVGAIQLLSNAMANVNDDDAFYYYDKAGRWGVDQSSQFTYASAVPNDDWAPSIRLGGYGRSAYTYEQWSTQRTAAKFVHGTFTVIENVTGSASTGNTYKLDGVGSTLRYYDNGSEHASSPATDTSLDTPGYGPGIVIYLSGGSVDDFVGTGIGGILFRGS